MSKLFYFIILTVSFILISCSNATKFTISTVAPAADITATKKQDNNNNFVIELTAKNLAAPNRLNPPKNNYSVWIVAEDGMVKNIGQLINKNSEKAILKTVTPFNATQIFITAEESGSLSYPTGVEISRASFKK